MIQILLVDDHPIMGEGTKLIIENERDMSVTFETSSLRALELVKTNTYDVMIFDLSMPEMDGFDLTKKVLTNVPNANILIYSGYDMDPYFDLVMDSGAMGFISKTATKDQLIRAIRCALDQEIILPYSFLKELYQGVTQSKALPSQESTKNELLLSEKEKIILRELEKGKKNKEIAQGLFIGQRSLEYSLTNLFHKLGVSSRLEAVVTAKESGLLDN